MTNSLPWFFDGPNRNRWFTVLKSMVDLSMAMSNNQMVVFFCFYVFFFNVLLFFLAGLFLQHLTCHRWCTLVVVVPMI